MKHPNAAVAGGTTGAAAVLAWLGTFIGIELDPPVAIVIAGGLTSLALLVGRKGVKGVIGTIWKGNTDTPPPGP